MPTVGENIARLREQRGLSQVGLADLLKVRQPSVAKWEKGKNPSAKTLVKIAKALRCSVDDFFEDVDVEYENQRRQRRPADEQQRPDEKAITVVAEFNPTPDERELLQMLRHLSDQAQTFYLDFMRDFVRRHKLGDLGEPQRTPRVMNEAKGVGQGGRVRRGYGDSPDPFPQSRSRGRKAKGE